METFTERDRQTSIIKPYKLNKYKAKGTHQSCYAAYQALSF